MTMFLLHFPLQCIVMYLNLQNNSYFFDKVKLLKLLLPTETVPYLHLSKCRGFWNLAAVCHFT